LFDKYEKEIVLFGYATNVHELMSVSDIIITKPGGITSSEVLAKRIPMIIVNPLPGQEANNTAYLTEKGAAIKIDKPEEVNISQTEGESVTILEIRVAPDDAGKVIGKDGRIANAIRTIVKAAGAKNKKRLTVEIMTQERM
jgi:predicted RNA-binding protein YlqC (UPF0109 family)